MDCLQGWPEPIVRVQSLSETKSTVIPPRYVKPPSQRPSSSPAVDLSIPVVDFSRCDAITAVSDACRGWGFFQVVNHGVDPCLMRRAREDWRQFFHLPMEEKQVYANTPKTYEGYGSRLGIEEGAILDWGDYYYLHLLPLCLKSHQKWPSLPRSLSRATVEEYGEELIKFCGRVMRVLSLGLGLDEGHLQTAFGGENCGVCTRVNFYPKCPQPELTLGLSSHSDPGGITVLLPDDRVKGLQVRRGDAWVTVKRGNRLAYLRRGLFAIYTRQKSKVKTHKHLIRPLLYWHVLSNAAYKSVEHRVLVNADDERLSIAYLWVIVSILICSYFRLRCRFLFRVTLV
ncbi:probable 2-oxoglutarate-dependent dioxygenase At3g111800 [Asparagus officinalis]|uniref:probable 2-oxoglutarate-dependent dioxygenase At3g111800 n=1 Tax=Asparagus officinalis TaxID=4686 RepID=UPI00098E71F8|nr:probable 2-oxoglutarate-dependent dioxygenase At3g111800 [Asparagus officinalis]